jgi:hypothetical protein
VPVALTNSGAGFIIPPGTPTVIGAHLSGEIEDESLPAGVRTRARQLPANLFVDVDAAADLLSVDGTFDFTFTVEGQTFNGSVNVMLSGRQPFVNVAPIADTGGDRTLICPQTVTLDASGTFDKENNIIDYSWTVDHFFDFFGQTAQVPLGEGVHAIELTVTDTFSGVGTDEATITIIDPAPEFTFVPPDITVTACGSFPIGEAQATSPCGPVTVTSDSPGFFFSGVTVVTWTAVSPTGKTSTAKQRILVIPNEDPACCPPGSNVIVGNDGANQIVGTPGADCIIARSGPDTIDSLGGIDVINSGQGDDVVLCGDDDDVVNGALGHDHVQGGSGADILFGGAGDDELDGGEGHDELSGEKGSDSLICGPGNDLASGGDNDDHLSGGPGDDRLDGGAQPDICVDAEGANIVLSCTLQ